jgi:type I restriction enzyme S subunit
MALLGSIIKTEKGKKPSALVASCEEGLPYLTTDFLRTGVCNQWIKRKNLSEVKTCEPTDIILIWDGSNSGECFTGFEGVLASTMVKIVPSSNKHERAFLFFLLKASFELLNTNTTGSTIPHVSRNVLDSISVPEFSIPEQQAIAKVLRAVQEAKEAWKQELRLERERKAALMQYLFTHGTRGETRKSSSLGEIPESWKITQLSELIDVTHGYAFKSKFFTTSGNVVLTPGNFLLDGGLYWGERTKFTTEIYPPEFLLKTADLVMVMTDLTPTAKLLGAPAFIPTDRVILHNQRIGKVIIKQKDIEPNFLYYLFSSGAFRKHMVLTATGSMVRHTSPTRIKDYKFALPPQEEREKIVNILLASDYKIQSLQAEITLLGEIFNTMLDELISGRLSIAPLLEKAKKEAA